jgi:hypothetical protein
MGQRRSSADARHRLTGRRYGWRRGPEDLFGPSARHWQPLGFEGKLVTEVKREPHDLNVARAVQVPPGDIDVGGGSSPRRFRAAAIGA